MQINLKEIRQKNRISQNDLAEKIGVSAPYICRVEKGNQTLSLSIAINIADYFNISLDELVGRKRLKGERNEFDS
ncbi:MAG: helix-turn-helix domain-containing protein [Ruminococcus sp.]|nr:helix-turn-helix domain-containing protein [Ruminococcus sp.]